MTSSQYGAARICGEQDCKERTNLPDHPLCYPHWQDSQDDVIDECPNHPGVYKPSEYLICRVCYDQNRQPAQAVQAAGTTISQQPQNESRGWNRQPTPETRAVSPSVTAAVDRVRQNLMTHRRECVNHETSTIQYLITPMLRGLGWDFDDPNQVRTEFNPEDKRRYGQSRVDIALLEKGSLKVFVEAKRLDREYDHGYLEQLDKYASFLRQGGIAVLTNGRFWQFYAVESGKTYLQHTIDLADGEAESAARELHKAIGKEVISNSVEKAAPDAPTQRPSRLETPTRTPSSDEVRLNLLRYRRDCYREMVRRGWRAYYIVNDETIERIVAQKPTDPRQLESIQGIGPSTLQRHGDAIIRIVRGEG